jgi:methionine sulfoxide reductase catalytic subunit
MLIKHSNEIPPSEITPEPIYQERRHFMQGIANVTATMALGSLPIFSSSAPAGGVNPPSTNTTPIKFLDLKKGPFSTDETLTPLKNIQSYANFYEFGTDKSDPMRNAHRLVTRPWIIDVDGEVEKPGTIDIEQILQKFSLKEHIYRLRCVEAWSMVIPWVGFPLGDFIKRFQPTSKAKYVQFFTLHDPKQMPGQNRQILSWPYTEGLRMDEALHPLTILSVGLYGKVLPNENGAPIRLVVPWKYGFKSIKSIVKIRFVERQPMTSWEEAGPSEYGFYANVNPKVEHPRWSQKKERRIGEFFKRETLMFNGYAEQVASLYTGMNLRKFY